MKRSLSALHTVLLFSPLALLALVALLAQPVNSQRVAFLQNFWRAKGDDIYNTNSRNVGIGTMDPKGKLEVRSGSYDPPTQNLSLPPSVTGVSSNDMWQSFTPTVSGRLSHIVVNTRDVGSTMWTFTLYEGEGTSGTILHTQTVDFPGAGPQTIALNAVIAISSASGQKYTYRLQKTSGTTPDFLLANGTYSGGRSNLALNINYSFDVYIGRFVEGALGLIVKPDSQTGIGKVPGLGVTLDIAGLARATHSNGNLGQLGTANSGVFGQSLLGGGYGLFGSAANGTGVFGEGGFFGVYGKGGQYGGFFQSNSNNYGYALYAENTANGNFGAIGIASVSLSAGVYGKNGNGNTGSLGTGTEGTYGYSFGNNGIFGQTDAAGKAGVYGLATASSMGVRGEGGSYGTYGYSNAGFGAAGVSNSANYAGMYAVNNSSGYGLWARSSGGQVAIYSEDNFVVAGNKAFRIDHPLDPANKYLLHYCTESPEPKLAYDGIVTTDANGEAWVELPDYFQVINTHYRYTLTVVDDNDSPEFIQAKVAHKIMNNRFKIRTSAPNVEVSWEVKGVRNDRYVQRYGAPVEQEKIGAERGKYQHPELYTQPESMRIGYKQAWMSQPQAPKASKLTNMRQ